MNRDQLIKRLMTTFLQELEEHVGALNRNLLDLEKHPDGFERTECIRTLLRTAHSLKGAARSVDVGVLERACHHLEEILTAVRDHRAALGPDLFTLLFAAADGIEEAGMRLREQQELSDAPLAELLPRLAAAASGVEQPAPLPRTEVREPKAEAAVNPPAPAAAPAVSETVAETIGIAGTVRIAAEKLDMFLARSGELLVARQRVQARVEDLGVLRERVTRWKAEWRAVEKALGPLLERNAAESGAATATALPRRVSRTLARTGEHLRRLEKDLDRLTATVAGDGRTLEQAATALDDEVRRVRMLPFAEACQGLDRMVRDLAHAGGKEAELVLEGGAVELDRSVLEGLKDPLRHLVRNAVDHGLENPEERRTAGKPLRGRVLVSALLRGPQVEVVVADDGRGLDVDALREQLRKRGLAEPADERELARQVFVPGLSTAPIVTDVSGRGVGLDVVKSRVESLHGSVDLSSVQGQGTRFRLSLPLTLTTLRAVLVGAAGQTFALVGTSVQQLLRVEASRLRSVEGRQMLALGGAPLPVASLAETLGLRAVPKQTGGTVVPPISPSARSLAAVVAAGGHRVAFVVDELLAEQEILIKGLGTRIRRVPHVSGATLLPSGRIALVLNAMNLVRTALARAPLASPVLRTEAHQPVKKRILLVDDSVTTRTLEKIILEAAGYEVLPAADGAAAWQLLQERGADLIVSDVEMPRLDGFGLTEAVRGSPRFRSLPVVLVTAREGEQDRARGLAVGASAYLIKSAFDQRHLLETIAQLL